MAQTTDLGLSTYQTGDQLTASAVNAIVSGVQGNGTDAESRLAALESAPTATPRTVTAAATMQAVDFGDGSLLTVDAGSAVTVTVPSGLSVSTGDKAVILQAGAGQVSIAAGSGVTITTPETLNAAKQHAQLVLTCTGTDAYVLGGYMEVSA